MSYSSSDIEREVEASRANVEDTVEALKDKMSFGQMLDEGMRYFGNRGGSEMMTNLGSQVRDNPLPLLLIGAGVAWLMSGRGTPHVRMPSFGGGSGSRGSRDEYRYDEGGYGSEDYGSQSGFSGGAVGDASVYSGSSNPDYSGTSYASEGSSSTGHGSASGGGGSMVGRAGEALSGVGSTLASVASTAASVASTVGRTAYSAAGTVAGGARVGAGAAWRGGGTAFRGATRVGSGAYRGASWVGSGAYEGASWAGSGAYRGASDVGYRARRSMSDVIETEPLVLAGLGLAVGAAMGAMLPRTEMEDRYMGETRDRLAEEAEEFARQKWEQGRTVASEAYRTAMDEAQAQGLTSTDEDSIVGRVGQVARATMERVRETAEEQGLTAGLTGSGSEGGSGGDFGQGSSGSDFGQGSSGSSFGSGSGGSTIGRFGTGSSGGTGSGTDSFGSGGTDDQSSGGGTGGTGSTSGGGSSY